MKRSAHMRLYRVCILFALAVPQAKFPTRTASLLISGVTFLNVDHLPVLGVICSRYRHQEGQIRKKSEMYTPYGESYIMAATRKREENEEHVGSFAY